MTDEQQATQLAEWLEKNPGEAPPEGIDPDVIEAVYALRPDLAPAASVGVDDILSRIQSGPFSDAKSDSEETPQVVNLADVRKTKRRRWAVVGSIAAAACVLIIAIPQKDEAAKIGPQTQGPPKIYTPKSSELQLDLEKARLADFGEEDAEIEEDLDANVIAEPGKIAGGGGNGTPEPNAKKKESKQFGGSLGSKSKTVPPPAPAEQKAAKTDSAPEGAYVEAELEANTSRGDQEADGMARQILGTPNASSADEPANESGSLLEFEEMSGSMKPTESESGGVGALKSRSGRSRSRNEATPTVRGQLSVGQAKVEAEDDETDEITSAINAQKSRIKQCYEIELRNNPSLEGQVTISFEVLQGRVLESKIIKNTTRNLNLAKCIKSKVDQLTFSKDVEANVEYPFVFTPSR